MVESDSDRMPLDEHPHLMTNGERRDAQVRVLEALGAHLSDQMAELVVGQRKAALHRKAMVDRVDALEAQLVKATQATADVLEVMEYAKLGFRVIGWIATAAGWVGFAIKWMGGIAAAALALWAAYQAVKYGGNLPPPGGNP